MIMPVLAQFMRLLASVCVCSRLCASARVCVRLLASVCVCVRLLASVCVCSRLCASVSRLCASARVCVRLLANARVCVRLFTSVCVCSRQRFRMLASVRVFASVRVIRVIQVIQVIRVRGTGSFHTSAYECLRLCASVCVCLASVCVCVRLLANARVCVRLCASGVLSRVGRLVSRMCASACGNWLILCVSRHSKSSKVGGTGSVHASTRVILSPCLLSYNVLMLKYPSHHLIYIFYHPMPIMPLY